MESMGSAGEVTELRSEIVRSRSHGLRRLGRFGCGWAQLQGAASGWSATGSHESLKSVTEVDWTNQSKGGYLIFVLYFCLFFTRSLKILIDLPPTSVAQRLEYRGFT